MIKSDFEKFAISNGIGSARLDQVEKKMITPTMGYVNPMILEERQLNITQMDVFSKLMQDKIIFLGDEIDSYVGNVITSQLMYLNSIDDGSDIKLFLNTPGGSIGAGMMIYDAMHFVTPSVSTYCVGLAASMGSVLLSSGERGKRFILPNGEVMLHQPLGNTGYSQARDIELYNEHIQKYKDKLYKILSQNTGKTYDEIKEVCDRDKWYDAEEALAFGLVDEIITKKDA